MSALALAYAHEKSESVQSLWSMPTESLESGERISRDSVGVVKVDNTTTDIPREAKIMDQAGNELISFKCFFSQKEVGCFRAYDEIWVVRFNGKEINLPWASLELVPKSESRK